MEFNAFDYGTLSSLKLNEFERVNGWGRMSFNDIAVSNIRIFYVTFTVIIAERSDAPLSGIAVIVTV